MLGIDGKFFERLDNGIETPPLLLIVKSKTN
jgi:hypothetical protein